VFILNQNAGTLMDDLDNRIARLERFVTLLSVVVGVLAVSLAAIIVSVIVVGVPDLSAAIAVGSFGAITFVATKGNCFTKEVTAQRFVLVDEHGRTLAILGPQKKESTNEDGVGLAFFQGDNCRASLWCSVDTAELSVAAPGSRTVITTAATFSGLMIDAMNAGAALAITDGLAAMRVQHGEKALEVGCMIGADQSGAIQQFEKAGKVAWSEGIKK
jgi:hypothetical protein